MPSAYVLINCYLGSEDGIIDKLSKIGGVKDVRGTYGVYDVVAKVEAPDMETLEQIVTSKIRQMKNIHSTLTLLIIDSSSSKPYYDTHGITT